MCQINNSKFIIVIIDHFMREKLFYETVDIYDFTSSFVKYSLATKRFLFLFKDRESIT